jgi:OFA family oxalate/formate antiporter-like MFS transporter
VQIIDRSIKKDNAGDKKFMYRYLTLLWSIVIQICLGAVYAWSTFVVPMKKEYGLSSMQTQVVFGMMIGIFAIMMIVTGRLLEKYSSRLIAALGGVAYGSGYLLASFSEGNFFLLLIAFGLITGAGLGLVYISSIISCQKCFPRQKGLATGMVVAGFGSGAVSISLIVKPLLDKGIDILFLFRSMGIVYLIVIFIGAMFLKTPPEKTEKTKERVRLRDLVKQKIYRTMFLCMFTGTFAGLMIIGNLLPIGISLGANTASAALAISTFAIGNATGRIIWGRLYDKLGRATITASLALMAISLLCLLLFGYSNSLFPIFACTTGFSFGANLVLYAAHTADIYGIRLVGLIYPYVALAYGASAIIGPTFGGLCYDLRDNFTIPLITAFLLSMAGAVLFFLHCRRRRKNRSAETFQSI